VLKSLYGKLVLALLAILVLVAVIYIAVGLYVTDLYLQEVRQKLNADLAAHLIDEGLLLPDGNVDPDALKHIIHMLMVINPSIEVYVLDPEGRVLAYSTPPGKLHRERVSLEPVLRSLEPDARLPILGDDPRDPTGSKVFSAEVIGDRNRPEGFVYVVLGGTLYDSVVQRLSASYVSRMGAAALVAGLVFAFAAGLVVVALLTRRLRRLASEMDAFEASGFTSPPDSPGRWRGEGGDEIDRLGETFEGMSRRIGEQLTELERADRMRRELVANVSHDLRTPLSSLHGYLETLLLKGDRIDPEERRRYLEIATRNSGSLSKRIAALFELAKLDAYEVRLEEERFSLAELVQDVVQDFEMRAREKRVELHTEREEKVPFVVADIGLIERALENLIGNAVRHTPSGGRVTVSIRTDHSEVSVEVRDTGPGIPPDELPSVFDRFYRCRADESGGGGTGLGLAIAKRIVDLHRGSIRADSTIGEGTVFTLTLPVPTS
jgi:signal transduction histidine kinase